MVISKTIISVVIVIVIISIAAFAFVSANSHNTKINIVSNSSLKNGDKIILELSDEYRNVYPSQPIDIKILDDSGWAEKYSVVTDSNGQASLQLKGLKNGNYTVHCNYNGTLFNKADHSISSLTIDDGYGF